MPAILIEQEPFNHSSFMQQAPPIYSIHSKLNQNTMNIIPMVQFNGLKWAIWSCQLKDSECQQEPQKPDQASKFSIPKLPGEATRD